MPPSNNLRNTAWVGALAGGVIGRAITMLIIAALAVLIPARIASRHESSEASHHV